MSESLHYVQYTGHRMCYNEIRKAEQCRFYVDFRKEHIMLIPNRSKIQNEKGLLLLMVLDILKRSTGPDKHMSKQELLKRIEHDYGFKPARGTLNEKLSSLEHAGFPVVQDGRDGVYYDGADLEDGELRFLIDSVMYSSFTTRQGADEMIRALLALGSPGFQEQMNDYISRIKRTRKNKHASIFLVLDEVQKAIYNHKQIRCNSFTYTDTLETALVYPESIIINPYELAYKNGKYYLFGALGGNEVMLSWRVDRLCNVEVLESKCVEIPLCKEIRNSGGWAKYIDGQPELSGGKMETFKLQCSHMSMDKIVDTFGRDFVALPHPDLMHNPDLFYIQIRSTRESMKAWAILHADRVVIIDPDEVYQEIKQLLIKADNRYEFANQNAEERVRRSTSFEDAIQIAKAAKLRRFIYGFAVLHRKLERIDDTLFSGLEELEILSLHHCQIDSADFLARFPNLRVLGLTDAVFDTSALQFASKVTYLSLSQIDETAKKHIRKMKSLETISISSSDVTDLSFLLDCPALKRVEISKCDRITDYSVLNHIPALEEIEIYRCQNINDYSFLNTAIHLKSIWIKTHNFSYPEAIRLQKYLPNCHIICRGYNDGVGLLRIKNP